MEENLGKLGIMDFFNVLFAGGIFVICVSWICPELWSLYTNINGKYQYESYVGIIVLFFCVGMILQEAGSYYDSKYEHIKNNVLKNFLREDLQIEEGKIESILKKIKGLFKLKKENIVEKEKKNKIIDNAIKLEVYRKHGKEILDNKEYEFTGEFSHEECKFIYAYCIYYIENKGKSAKYEKMRGLFDMSRTMMSSSLLLLLGSCIMLIYNLIVVRGFNIEIENIVQIFIFALCTVIFCGRAKRIMNYKARMLMEVYDVCMDINKESKFCQ